MARRICGVDLVDGFVDLFMRRAFRTRSVAQQARLSHFYELNSLLNGSHRADACWMLCRWSASLGPMARSWQRFLGHSILSCLALAVS
jgi:hypothetical protein